MNFDVVALIFFVLGIALTGLEIIFIFGKKRKYKKQIHICDVLLACLAYITSFYFHYSSSVEPNIIIRPKELEIMYGDEYSIEAITEPQSAVIEWHSDEPEIVSVDNRGSINALNEGRAIISAKLTYFGNEYVDYCEVEVKKPRINVIPFCSIDVNKRSDLSVITFPEDIEVSWKSSNSKIVSVDEKGGIFGVARGKAKVTASIVYNDKTYSASCEINVNDIEENKSELENQDIDDFDINSSAETVDLSDGRTPLSSAILVRTEDCNGYLVNSNYSTIIGTGYSEEYIATSFGKNFDEVISVCSYSPFRIIYNLDENYDILSGEISFDDITKSKSDILGVSSLFEGKAEVTFYLDDTEVEPSIILSTCDPPVPFYINVKGVTKLMMVFDFPYTNFVLEDFNKYFNIINAYLE